jgi:3',5'-cyclic AMP phosphodiesterase CpdA
MGPWSRPSHDPSRHNLRWRMHSIQTTHGYRRAVTGVQHIDLGGLGWFLGLNTSVPLFLRGANTWASLETIWNPYPPRFGWQLTEANGFFGGFEFTSSWIDSPPSWSLLGVWDPPCLQLNTLQQLCCLFTCYSPYIDQQWLTCFINIINQGACYCMRYILKDLYNTSSDSWRLLVQPLCPSAKLWRRKGYWLRVATVACGQRLRLKPQQSLMELRQAEKNKDDVKPGRGKTIQTSGWYTNKS